MAFHSPQFLIFFPVVTLAYFLVPQRGRCAWLLAASYFFYLCWNPEYVVLLLLVTAVSYAAALQADRRQDRRWRRGWTAAGIAATLAGLFFFKYFNFAADTAAAVLSWVGITAAGPHLDLVLPMGLSFYTFQAVG